MLREVWSTVLQRGLLQDVWPQVSQLSELLHPGSGDPELWSVSVPSPVFPVQHLHPQTGDWDEVRSWGGGVPLLRDSLQHVEGEGGAGGEAGAGGAEQVRYQLQLRDRIIRD